MPSQGHKSFFSFRLCCFIPQQLKLKVIDHAFLSANEALSTEETKIQLLDRKRANV